MKKAFLLTGVCGVTALIAVAAQNGEFERRGPQSRIAGALDTNHDDVISGTEISAASAALKALDANHDGRLAAEELRPGFGPGGRRGRGDEGEGRGGPPAASADDLADTLMAFDRNGDGRLERAEVPERFQGLYDRADGNKDGVLTRDELKQSATATIQNDEGRGRRGGREGGGFGRGRGGAMADPLMRVLDTDRDGVLSDAELAKSPEALKTLDANHDGKLSVDEFRPQPTGGRDDGGGRER